MKARFGWIGQAIAWLVILIVLGVLAVCVVVPKVGGGTAYTVLTGSMRPDYPPGTLVVVRPTPIDKINVGDVVTYQIEPKKPDVITHRVIGTTTAADGTARLIMKGDNNNAQDPKQVQAAQVKGKLWYSAPKVGRLNLLFDKAQHQALGLIAGGALLAYAAYAFISAALDRKPNRKHSKKDKKEEVTP